MVLNNPARASPSLLGKLNPILAKPGQLPREAVAAPSLAVFKARLDGALSNLV